MYYLSYVDKRGADECWPWTGGRRPDNYGSFGGGKNGSMSAHRYGFEQLVRPLEPGETVDHTCHNRDTQCPGSKACEHRACQNPAHWEAVGSRTNKARAWSTRNAEITEGRIAKMNASYTRKTRCKWGHELTPENSYGYKGRRQCKTCARLAARGEHPRQLGAQPPAPAA